MQAVAEGVRTAKAALGLALRCGVDMPIVREVHAVLFADKSCRQAVGDLMERVAKEEKSLYESGPTQALLTLVQRGVLDVPDALHQLRTMPYENLGFASLDHHRALRQGFPEVIFCEGKTECQVVAIAKTRCS